MNQDTETNWIGDRLVKEGVLTPSQRDKVIAEQQRLQDEGVNERFGIIAVRLGFCETSDVESIPGYIGDLLVDSGIITLDQHFKVMKKQDDIFQAEGRYHRYGDIATEMNFCMRESVEECLLLNRIGLF